VNHSQNTITGIEVRLGGKSSMTASRLQNQAANLFQVAEIEPIDMLVT